jgi:glutamyl-tRNA reductase
VLDDLTILHLRSGVTEELPTPLRSVQWQTCLRKILFLHRADFNPELTTARVDVEPYTGAAAYRFLLEVVCGLNSPLLGETAVMGQFREFCAEANLPPTSWGWFLRQFMADVLADAKRVRHDHLEGLGSQSYGGLVRQHLARIPLTAVLGSGQLAEEILPWITAKTQVRLFSRNLNAGEALLSRHAQIQIDQFTDAAALWDEQATALVIAAPLSADQIENWIKLQPVRFSKILDLRGEAATDPLRSSLPVIALPQLFATLNRDRGRLDEGAAAARAAIARLAQRQTQQAQFRPFGWEDLCA